MNRVFHVAPHIWLALVVVLAVVFLLIRQRRRVTPDTPVIHAGRSIAVKRIPLRSPNRDAQREVHAYAEQIAGRPLSWKAARKLLKAHNRAGRFA